MYLTNEELKRAFSKLSTHFSRLSVLVDCYTPFAVKMSKIKNPINDVGVTKVYGIENSSVLEIDTGLTFIKEHTITPQYLIDELKGFEKLSLKPGESKTVEFTLTPADMAFCREDMQFAQESGDFKVWVGNSSDATLEGQFTVR